MHALMPKYGKWRQEYQKFKVISVTYPVRSQPRRETLSRRKIQAKEDTIQIITQEQAMTYTEKPSHMNTTEEVLWPCFLL